MPWNLELARNQLLTTHFGILKSFSFGRDWLLETMRYPREQPKVIVGAFSQPRFWLEAGGGGRASLAQVQPSAHSAVPSRALGTRLPVLTRPK